MRLLFVLPVPWGLPLALAGDVEGKRIWAALDPDLLVVRAGDTFEIENRRRLTLTVLQTEGVFVFNPKIPHIGQNSQNGNTGHFFNLPDAGFEKRFVPTKFVDDDSGEKTTVLFRQKADGSIDTCEYTSSINVGHQYHGSTGIFCHGHVNKVFGLQVDFSWTACAF